MTIDDPVQARKRLLELRSRQRRVADAGPAAAARPDELPVNCTQEGLWFIEQLEGAAGLYDSLLAVRLQGALDEALLQRCLRALVVRHESLRTTFEAHPDDRLAVRQRVQAAEVADTLAFELQVIDGEGAEALEAPLQHWIAAGAGRPFDLAQAPLMRARLARLAPGEHVLMLVLHHIVFDGWSRGVLLRELGALYAAGGAASVLPALPLHSADHALWQRRWLGGAAAARQLGFWRTRLSGLNALDLPTDRPRPAHASYRGAARHLALDAAQVAPLRALAQREGATLFMLLLAAFQVLLQRHARQPDIALGVPVAGRLHAGLEGLIGCFVNTLVLRTDLSGNPAFTELLARVRQVALDAYANQDMPFDRLVTELAPQRDLGRHPLVQVSFQLDNQPRGALQLPGLQVQPLDLPRTHADFDLSVVFTEDDGALRGRIDYATELFDADTIDRLATQFRHLLAGIAADPARPIGWLPLMDADERRRLIDAGRGDAGAIPEPACIQRWIAAQVQRAPDAPAVISDGAVLSYAELDAQANRLAQHLRAGGVRPGVFVGVCLSRSMALPVAVLAVFKAGGVYVPLDPADPPQRRAFMLSDCAAPCLVSESALIGRLDGAAARIVSVDGDADAIAAHPAQPPDDLSNAEDAAFVIYTSGTTGRPKGVCVPQRALAAHARWLVDTLGLRPADRVLHKTSIGFDASLVELLEPLVAGAAIVLASADSERDTQSLVASVQAHGVSLLQMVPSALRVLLDEPGLTRCTSLRRLISGGEVLDRALAREVRRLLPQVALGNFYGPTETCIDATWHEVLTVEPGPGTVPIGRPLAHARCHVLDEQLQPQPIGLAGELFIGGEGLARAYLNAPELSAERFVADPFEPGQRLYRSGDLVRRRADGLLEFIGRADGQVKLRGVRIELGEIEAALAECPGVREAAVQLREDRQHLRQIVAYVAGQDLDTAGLREALRRRLNESMVPALFVELPLLPRLASGKLDRAALPMPALDLSPSGTAGAGSALEQQLADIWSEVLGVPEVGVHDSFFVLGGHSLLATRLAARIRAALHIDFALKLIFEAPTVAELARRIAPQLPAIAASASAPSPATHIGRCDRTQPLSVSYAQRRMWLLQQLEPGSVAYSVPLALRLDGPLDTVALAGALDAWVQRHEAFRTSFVLRGAEPELVVGAPAPAVVLNEDLRHLGPERAEAQAQQGMRDIVAQPFDLARGPLHRLVLLRVADARHWLLLVMHHSVCDDASVGILMRELSANYNALRAGRGLPSAACGIAFADYAAWQRASIGPAELQAQWLYWQGQLEGAQALSLLPDRSVGVQHGSRGQRVARSISPDLIGRVRGFSAAHGASPFMTLLAAYQWLLSVYSGQDDIAVGTPASQRTVLEAEPLVGCLVDTLVIRSDVSGDPSFTELLARVRTTALDAFAHQDMPFDHLVEKLRTNPATAAAGELRALFSLLQSSPEDLQLDGLEARLVGVDRRSAQLDLALSVDLGQPGEAAVTVASDVFDADTAQRLLDNYLGLLDQVLADPARPMSAWRIASDAEGQRMAAWNATAAAFDRLACVHEQVRVGAQRHASALALQCVGRSLSHAELEAASNRLAHLLRARGMGRGALVGLCVERGIDMVVALLAILKSGAAYVPLDPDYPAERLAYMAEDARLSLLVTQSALFERLAWPEAHTLLLDRAGADMASQPGEPPAADGRRDARPDDPAYVIYTSGSTGRPKGVVVSHGAVVNFLTSMAREPGLGAGDRLLAVTTLSFDIAVLELLLPLTVGAQVVLAQREQVVDGTVLLALLRDSDARVLQATPSTWRLLIDAGWTGAPGFKALIGGEALPPDLAQQLLARAGEVWNLYGPTETTVWSTRWKVESPQAGIRIGRPIANTQIHVLDAQRRPCPIGVAGEIFIGGGGVALGYLHRPKLTAERFVADPQHPGARLYRSGDLGRWCHDGCLEHLGRLDFQVKVRGHRIELGEVESVLIAHPAVARCVVIVREDQPGDARIVAYVVARERMPTVLELRDYLRASLPDYMLPQHVVVLDAIPLLPNGKIDRSRLPVPAVAPAADTAMGDAFVAPRNAREQAVAEIWERLLGVTRVGVQDNFFDLGGHSLLAARAAVEIARTLGLRVAARRLIFESLAQIAASPSDDAAVPAEPEASARGWLRRLFGKLRP